MRGNDAISRKALIVFAKKPAIGRVKTRLSPPLTSDEAANLYEAFLRDALESYATPSALGSEDPVTMRLYVDDAATWSDGFLHGPSTVFQQKGNSLGEKMLRAFVETFAADFDRIVIVGTDHPTLPTAFIAEAFRALATPFTVSIGPSSDGGYYLLGLNELYSSLFHMDYSHTEVFENTLAKATQEGANVVVLPEWYDVDDKSSLSRLLQEWRDGADIPLNTKLALQSLLEAYPELL